MYRKFVTTAGMDFVNEVELENLKMKIGIALS